MMTIIIIITITIIITIMAMIVTKEGLVLLKTLGGTLVENRLSHYCPR